MHKLEKQQQQQQHTAIWLYDTYRSYLFSFMCLYLEKQTMFFHIH